MFAYALEDWPEEAIDKAAMIFRLSAISCSRYELIKTVTHN